MSRLVAQSLHQRSAPKGSRPKILPKACLQRPLHCLSLPSSPPGVQPIAHLTTLLHPFLFRPLAVTVLPAVPPFSATIYWRHDVRRYPQTHPAVIPAALPSARLSTFLPHQSALGTVPSGSLCRDAGKLFREPPLTPRRIGQARQALHPGL